ncbi:MAG: SDR family oxidoreductase [Rhizobiaceae bacterium]|nr:SDR family oxidoreductase [Rhizobiaceae bacterium]
MGSTDMEGLRDKVVLVTGASKGMGAAIARTVGQHGARVIFHYNSDRAGAEEAGREIPAGHKTLIQADMHSKMEASRLWAEALAWRGRIDVFVNNAAVMLENGPIDADDEEWDAVWEETLQVNLIAPARLLREAVRHFREAGGGIIVSFSSWAGQRGSTNPGAFAYGTSKAAIKALTQSIARNYARDGVLAYVIAPGLIHTQMSETFMKSQGGQEKIFKELAMGEWGSPQEVADIVAFLATGKARYMAGATLDVNGATYIR